MKNTNEKLLKEINIDIIFFFLAAIKAGAIAAQSARLIPLLFIRKSSLNSFTAYPVSQ